MAGLPPVADDTVLWVIAPAEDVLLLDAPRVARGERQLTQALPFAVEDQLAAAVETQHVAWAPGSSAERVCVAVVANARIDAWLAQLRAAGLEPDALIPEALLLPWAPGQPQLLLEPGAVDATAAAAPRALLRFGPARAFVGTPSEIAALGIDLDGLRTTAVRGVASSLPADAGVIDDPLPLYAAALARALPLNLLQGRYAPPRRIGGVQRAWRWAAMLAAIGVLLAFSQLLVERQQLASRVQAQRADMVALYRQLAPGTDAIRDPAAYLRSALAASRSDDDPALRLLGLSAPALVADGSSRLDAIHWRNNALELVVIAPDIAALDALRARLADAHPGVELTAATPGSGGVEGRFRLAAAAGAGAKKS